MDTIKQRLEKLYDLLVEISPIAEITEDPFDKNTDYSTKLINTLSDLIFQAEKQKEKIEKENEQLCGEISLYCEQLEIEEPQMSCFCSSVLKNEYIKNELKKILILRNKIKNEIESLKNEIEILEIEINDVESNPKNHNIFDFNDISIKNLEILKNIKNSLIENVKSLESKRQQFYDEIILFNNKLSRKVEFSYEERIYDLRKMLNKIKEEYESKKKQYEYLLGDIKRKELILNIQNQEFDQDFNINTLNEMIEYNNFLETEQKRLFDDIFDRTLLQINDLRQVIGKKATEYSRIESSLIEMRSELDRLTEMKDLYVEIANKIDMRRELLIKMTEFEKIASDPRRLFKSSFQLNSEEKFRNSAYPSLLKMEETLFDLIDQFEKKYETFIFENSDFKTTLKNEIEHRIINRTVFISRCDSPFRKKK